jgi:predicted nucleic acid-binding protein
VKYLVDANVLSEPTKPAPDPRVVAWLRAHEPDIAVDPVILGELRFGILILPKGRKRTAWNAGSTREPGVSTVCPGTRKRD